MRLVLQPMVISTASVEAAIETLSSGRWDVALELLPGGGYYDIWDDARTLRLQAALAGGGVCVQSVHAPFGDDIDLSTFALEPRDRAEAEILKSIEVCAALGGRVVVIHPGDALRKDGEAERLAYTLRIMPSLAGAAEAAGVQLAVENMPPGHVGARMDTVMQVVEAADSLSVGVCYDTGHANLHAVFEGPEPAGDRLYEIHAHDNRGAVDEHLPPGHGTIDWQSLRATLDGMGYTHPILLECAPSKNETWAEMVAAFRDLTGYAPGG